MTEFQTFKDSGPGAEAAQPRPEGEGALTGAAAPAENPRTRGPRRLGHRWSECEDRALRKLWAENISAAGIAVRLSRSRAAVAARASNLGLALRTPLWGGRRSARCHEGERAERLCLKCGESFASAHKGNRVCGTCKEDEDWSSGPDASQRRIPRRRHEEIDG